MNEQPLDNYEPLDMDITKKLYEDNELYQHDKDEYNARLWLRRITHKKEHPEMYDTEITKRGKTVLRLKTKYTIKFRRETCKEIRKKYHNRCCLCGKQESKCVHHIDYNKRNNEQNNLILLCRKCHGETITNRQAWKELFTATTKEER